MSKVICTNAKNCVRHGSYPGSCLHSVPHDRQLLFEDILDGTRLCTEWDECYASEKLKKVRCTKVKEK